jgi:outer membrane protein, heavy metal efflux system
VNRGVTRQFAALLFAVWPLCQAAGQEARPDTFRLATALQIALERNPMLHAARASARAATERIRPAGALQDPQLQLALMNRMTSGLLDTSDPMTMNQVQLMQMLPWPGKLAGARRTAQFSAEAANAEADEQARMLGAEVAMRYYEAASADRALEIMRRTTGLLQSFREVATAMYATGSGVQQDVLRAQIEVARMSEEITRMEQERLAAATRLNGLLGREGNYPVGPLELPNLPVKELRAVDTLIRRALQERPGVKARLKRVEAAEAAVSSARLELRPDFQLGVAYQQRPAFPNMASFMVSVNLPVFAKARQLPMRREASAVRDMSFAELVSLQNETAAQVISIRARAERDRKLVQLYQSSILPQARAAVDAALASYRVGRVTFMALVDNQMTVNRYEIETVQLVADYRQALSELGALVGESLEGDSK